MLFYKFEINVVKLLSVSFAELLLLWLCVLINQYRWETSIRSESKTISVSVKEFLLLCRI